MSFKQQFKISCIPANVNFKEYIETLKKLFGKRRKWGQLVNEWRIVIRLNENIEVRLSMTPDQSRHIAFYDHIKIKNNKKFDKRVKKTEFTLFYSFPTYDELPYKKTIPSYKKMEKEYLHFKLQKQLNPQFFDELIFIYDRYIVLK